MTPTGTFAYADPPDCPEGMTLDEYRRRPRIQTSSKRPRRARVRRRLARLLSRRRPR